MAGLLLVVLLCFFSETSAQALPPPKLTVNPAVITETDSVTLNCQTSVSVSQCYFNLGQENPKAFSCRKTLTGTRLLKVSRQRSPAEVKIDCFYVVRVGDVNSPSPRSDTSSVTIHRQKPTMSLEHFQDIMGKESSMITTKSPFPVTTVDQTLHESSTGASVSPVTSPNPAPDVTVSSPASTFITPSSDVTVSSPGDSTFVSPVTPSSDIVGEESGTTQTVMTTITMTTGLTVITTHATTAETPAEQTSGLTVSTPHVTTPETPARQTSVGQTLPVTPPSPAPETKLWKWKMWMLVIVVAGFGVIVGVTFVGVTLLCTKRRTERYSTFKRKQVNVTDDVVCMQSLDHGGMLPAGNDEHYSVITSVPGADCPAGSKKLDSQRSQNEDSDIYHVYASISEESSPSALNVVYSTVQAH